MADGAERRTVPSSQSTPTADAKAFGSTTPPPHISQLFPPFQGRSHSSVLDNGDGDGTTSYFSSFNHWSCEDAMETNGEAIVEEVLRGSADDDGRSSSAPSPSPHNKATTVVANDHDPVAGMELRTSSMEPPMVALTNANTPNNSAGASAADVLTDPSDTGSGGGGSSISNNKAPHPPMKSTLVPINIPLPNFGFNLTATSNTPPVPLVPKRAAGSQRHQSRQQQQQHQQPFQPEHGAMMFFDPNAASGGATVPSASRPKQASPASTPPSLELMAQMSQVYIAQPTVLSLLPCQIEMLREKNVPHGVIQGGGGGGGSANHSNRSTPTPSSSPRAANSHHTHQQQRASTASPQSHHPQAAPQLARGGGPQPIVYPSAAVPHPTAAVAPSQTAVPTMIPQHPTFIQAASHDAGRTIVMPSGATYLMVPATAIADPAASHNAQQLLGRQQQATPPRPQQQSTSQQVGGAVSAGVLPSQQLGATHPPAEQQRSGGA